MSGCGRAPRRRDHQWRKIPPRDCRLIWKLTSGSVGQLAGRSLVTKVASGGCPPFDRGPIDSRRGEAICAKLNSWWMSGFGPRPTPRGLRAASPLTEVHRPRARQAAHVVGAPAYDPKRARAGHQCRDAITACISYVPASSPTTTNPSRSYIALAGLIFITRNLTACPPLRARSRSLATKSEPMLRR
jgi:hypothetical protein